MKRKPVAGGQVSHGQSTAELWVLCDDGSFWLLKKGKWNEGPPIPGTEHEVRSRVEG
jgi:hypothetical protein